MWPAFIVMILFSDQPLKSCYFSGLSNRIIRKIFSHWRLEPVYIKHWYPDQNGRKWLTGLIQVNFILTALLVCFKNRENNFTTLLLTYIAPTATAADDILKYFYIISGKIKKPWHFMRLVYLADNSHEMSSLIFPESKFI